MRLELALVVGILFFCSWCAYIVARMSWSINAVGQTGQITAGGGLDQMGARAQIINQTSPPQAQILIDQFAQHQQRPANAGPHQTPAAHQQTRQFEASEPVPSHQQLRALEYAGLRQRQQQATRTPLYSQPVGQLNSAGQWQAYPLPSRDQPVGELEYYDEAAGAGDDHEVGVSGPEDQAAEEETYSRPRAEASEGPDDAREDEQAPDYDDYERPPPTQSELEEISDRRSFSELESDSRERDKDGRLVKSKRRHLINGKPVSGYPNGRERRRRQQTRRSDRSELPVVAAATESRKRAALVDERRDGADDQDDEDAEDESQEKALPTFEPDDGSRSSEGAFEGMVREIDLEDRLQRAAAAKAVATAVRNDRGGQVPGSNATEAVKFARRSNQEPPEVAAQNSHKRASASQNRMRDGAKRAADRDSHRHQVQETLVATKWDDETQNGPNGTELVGAQVEELSEPEDEDQAGNIVERDQDVQELERLSRQSLTDAARVPDELEQRRWRRKKREARPDQLADACQTSGTRSLEFAPVERPTSRAGADDGHARGRPPRRPRSLPPDPERSNGLEQVHAKLNPSASNNHEVPVGRADDNLTRPPIVSSILNASDDVAKSELNSNEKHSNKTRLMGQQSSARDDANSTRAADIEHVSRAPDSIGSSEDMHVAVLADPPPLPPPPATSNSQLLFAPNVSSAAATGAEGQPHVSGGNAAHHAGRHLALGSHELAAKRPHKVKRRKKLVKRRRVAAAKYHAARAHANKRRRRLKKGDMRRKRRKSHKHSLASRKQFEGLTKGKKLGRGHKLQGAKKRSALVKDKGYRKRGFKKSYHKLETGDHKTYFDEFRDKDHKKRWKDFDDKHKYSQKKKWTGYDSKRHHRHKLDQAHGKASKLGKWRESSRLEHSREANKYEAKKKLAGHNKVKRSRKE